MCRPGMERLPVNMLVFRDSARLRPQCPRPDALNACSLPRTICVRPRSGRFLSATPWNPGPRPVRPRSLGRKDTILLKNGIRLRNERSGQRDPLNQQHSALRTLLKLPLEFVPHSFRHTYGTRLGNRAPMRLRLCD